MEHDTMNGEQPGEAPPPSSTERQFSHEENLKRSAQMKAAIISLLNNSETPLTRAYIGSTLQELANELQYKPHNFDNFLYSLSKNGLIKKLGKNTDGAGYMYAGPKYEGPLELTPTGRPVRKYNKRVKKNEVVETAPTSLENVQPERINPMPQTSSAVTVDIVKSSGRIRVAIGGISIEIGVVD